MASLLMSILQAVPSPRNGAGDIVESSGSLNALLLLNLIRRERPEFYERAMELLWSRMWSKEQPALRTSHFFAVCRQLGFEFRECDDIVSRIQIQSNADDLMKRTKRAALAGVFDTPWLEVKCETGQSLGFSGIFSIPLVDFLLSRPDVFVEWSLLEETDETPTDAYPVQTSFTKNCSSNN
ncbi:unnamed protein product [Toxocara canis]|uniref:DSBA domain-containing protein n=1 Tax=Toxocara canis TaxID=6265 RepID=A0A183UZS0_TOXCA|nr:unnamed protein product [Toxocara canis]